MFDLHVLHSYKKKRIAWSIHGSTGGKFPVARHRCYVIDDDLPRRRRRRRHGCTPDSPRTPMFPRDRYGRPERPLSAVAEPIFFRSSAAHARHPGFPFSDHEARRAVEWRRGEDYAAAGAALVISIRCGLYRGPGPRTGDYAGVAATNFEMLKRFGDEVPANTTLI